MAKHKVSRSVVIDAPAADIFDILAAPHRHPEFDGSGWVRDQIEGPQRLGPGERFGMRMRMRERVPYRVSNRVVEFEKDRRIAWRHFGPHRWRWELRPVEGGTRVTETFDYSYGLAWFYQLVGYPSHNARSIERTLVRLKELTEKSN
ncbi:SRPBCC family protein [Halostreptopolyspora alba]|uniref:Dimethyladenosine transferase n=1 Tax=Halostreptopolyspora alba TaxID=2487137 RepID=A0A3N0E7U8_9ACTN|nr:dimethyladenosine transferase [Nocardiopsaceae bacterium YIM 96095]